MKYVKPKVKPMLAPFINEDASGIRVGGWQANISRDIIVDDAHEFYTLLRYLDGTHGLSDIEETFKLSETELLDLLNILQQQGIIFENEATDFSSEEIEYYSRALNFYEWLDTEGLYYNYWDVQRKLKNAKILVLGCGGTGSHAAVNLARLGIGNIVLSDFDNVELSNLNRQEFTYADVGKKKAPTLMRHLLDINPFITVSSKEAQIESAQDILDLGTDFDLVISCIDKPTNVSEFFTEYTKKTKIPWVLGNYASTVVTEGIFNESGISFKEIIDHDKSESYVAKTISESDDWPLENAIVSPVATISGSFSALYAMYYLTSIKRLEFNIIQNIDLYNVQDLANFSYIVGENKYDIAKVVH
ncbi:ThiF family adenylyltransferase [Weissella viridescens]|uniref:ThiF family adenylyltransferase n=1 Tax=Weissella viridescens TaxID=1629 RepID=A0A3P2RL91_WEIVI|nr:ThiF family adenylyltransferase [Weissella viridescens]RRG18432.1 ThiF family adenylyltransferase [Weissella viridescens]